MMTIHEVWERLQQRAIDVHFLMLAVAAGSAAIGAWGEGATLLFLFSFSGALEHYALGRTQREIRSLFREAPKVATVIDETGQERELKVEMLVPVCDCLSNRAAQFAVDAEIAKGQTASDESNLTGEATPVEKAGWRSGPGWDHEPVGSGRSPYCVALKKVRCKKSSASSKKRSIKKLRPSNSRINSALIILMLFSASRWRCSLFGG